MVTRIAAHEKDVRPLLVVIGFTMYRLLNLAFEKVLAIELEFLFCDVSPNLHCLGNRGEPDSALVIDEQRPADEGKASRGRLAIPVQLFHELDRLIPAIAC